MKAQNRLTVVNFRSVQVNFVHNSGPFCGRWSQTAGVLHLPSYIQGNTISHIL